MQPDLQFLYSLNRLGIKVGLDHTNALLKLNGDPQKNFSSIHVAGTNGKGSTCAMINSILLNMNKPSHELNGPGSTGTILPIMPTIIKVIDKINKNMSIKF